MNFPGLDPTYAFAHHAGRALRLIKPWSLEETRAGLDAGEKILVVATTALGDSLLTLPLIESLSARLGPDRVSLLVKTPYALVTTAHQMPSKRLRNIPSPGFFSMSQTTTAETSTAAAQRTKMAGRIG